MVAILALVPKNLPAQVIETVSTEAGFHGAISSGVNTINLAADIYLISGASIMHAYGMVINGNGYKLDGSSTVRCLTITSSRVTLLGLTVENSFASGENSGGGVFITSGSTTMINCTFRASKAHIGGGLAVVNGAAVIAGCSFVGNTATLVMIP